MDRAICHRDSKCVLCGVRKQNLQAGGYGVQNPANPEKSFGPQLKRERERSGITLDSISATTKVTIRYLQALEAERFDQLPGGILSKGIARGYVRCLGLDEVEWMRRYTEARKDAAELAEAGVSAFALNVSTNRASTPSAHFSILRWTGVGVLLLLLAGFGWFVWIYLHMRANSAQIPQVPAVYAAQVPVGEPTAAPAAQPSVSAQKLHRKHSSPAPNQQEPQEHPETLIP